MIEDDIAFKILRA